MPVERDRIIGELAVEQGLIGRDEVTRYYRMLDSQPGGAAPAGGDPGQRKWWQIFGGNNPAKK